MWKQQLRLVLAWEPLPRTVVLGIPLLLGPAPPNLQRSAVAAAAGAAVAGGCRKRSCGPEAELLQVKV